MLVSITLGLLSPLYQPAPSRLSDADSRGDGHTAGPLQGLAVPTSQAAEWLCQGVAGWLLGGPLVCRFAGCSACFYQRFAC